MSGFKWGEKLQYRGNVECVFLGYDEDGGIRFAIEDSYEVHRDSNHSRFTKLEKEISDSELLESFKKLMLNDVVTLTDKKAESLMELLITLRVEYHTVKLDAEMTNVLLN